MSSFVKKNWFVCLLIVVFAVISVYYIYDTNKGKLQGKTNNGEDVVYSINNTDTTTSKFYDDLYKNSGTAAAAQAFARAVASQGAETTEVMQTNAKAQVSSIISDYKIGRAHV